LNQGEGQKITELGKIGVTCLLYYVWHAVCLSLCMSVCKSQCLCVDVPVRTELDVMVDQVLNVLPHIPADVIRQDLGMCVMWLRLKVKLYSSPEQGFT